ncbi:MAG: ATP-binding protein [Cyanobacteria bacterium P01_F01_bin.150]
MQTKESFEHPTQFHEALSCRHSFPMASFAFEYITDIVFCLDEKARVFYLNRSGCQRLGYDNASLAALTLYSIAPHFSENDWPPFWSLLKREKGFEMDTLLLTHHGKEMAVNMGFTYIDEALPSVDQLSLSAVDDRAKGEQILDNCNRMAYCCVIVRDISVRKQTENILQALNKQLAHVIDQREQELQDSRVRLQNLADNIPGMIYQMCLDLTIEERNQSLTFTYASSGCMDVFGVFPEALQANSHLMFERVHPDDCQNLRASLLHSAKTLQPWNWEGRLLLPSGKVKWLQGGARSSYQVNQRVVWDGVFIDVSISKRREEALECIVEGTTPKAGQTFFQSCAQAIANALQMRYVIISEVIAVDGDKVKSLAFWRGDCFSHLKDYTIADAPCELVFGRKEIYRCDHGIQQEFPEMKLLQDLQAESYVGIPICEPSGGIIGHIALLDTQPMMDDTSLQNYVLKIFSTRVGAEISRQRAQYALQQSEMQLRQQAQELEQALRNVRQSHAQMIQSEKMSSLGELVAGVAHEINNPVSFIYGNVRHADGYVQDVLELISLYRTHYPHPVETIDSFLDELDIDFVTEDLPKTLASMKVGADRIKQIVKSLRNFSRMDGAKKAPMNIHEGLDSTIMILQNRLKARSDRPEIAIQRDFGDIPSVNCYGGQLNQVFMNLLSNAIDALDEKTVQQLRDEGTVTFEPMIRIQTHMAAESLMIHIIDNASGMTEEVRSRLFDAFFTTKPVGKGTGMGLSISYQIITEKHGGSLECKSKVGEGTEFIVTIPQ